LKEALKLGIALAGILCVALARGALAGTPAGPEAPNEGLYRVYCADCHGIEADGNGRRAPALRLAPPDLTHLTAKWGSPLPKVALTDFVMRAERLGTPNTICGERVHWGANQIERRIAVLAILGYLETVQAE
jgi:hypothetical protein